MIPKFNQQEPNVKIAIILGISLVISVSIYSIIISSLKKTDTTRCVEAYLEKYQNAERLDAYERCRYLLKR
ncbi:hypothetical protein BKG94_06280 [Rodentibacter ratti]|uniref:hypothetical protein n=1 Tax=Rodentibacter ratti TaxID=1906745 RepID=UPI000984193F|nr:hypothetical protein [Rodentibacter ratti]OOF88746.1 hypothetical protein BKG94_06280 [Rodentibacter ratti]